MVKATDIVEKEDGLGRAELPAGRFEIWMEQQRGPVVVQKAEKVCLRCRSTERLQEIAPGYYLCGACVGAMKRGRNNSLLLLLLVGILAFCCTCLCFEASCFAYWQAVLAGDDVCRIAVAGGWLPAVVGVLLLPLDVFVALKLVTGWHKN